MVITIPVGLAGIPAAVRVRKVFSVTLDRRYQEDRTDVGCGPIQKTSNLTSSHIYGASAVGLTVPVMDKPGISMRAFGEFAPSSSVGGQVYGFHLGRHHPSEHALLP